MENHYIFSGTWFSLTNQTDHHVTSAIMFKVALNTNESQSNPKMVFVGNYF